MMVPPKSSKYQKKQRGNLPLKSLSNRKYPSVGYWSIKSVGSQILTLKEIEAGRKALAKKLKKRGKIWVKSIPSHQMTAKPLEVRMGKGKGLLKHWVFKAKPGVILYEISKVERKEVKELQKIISSKLSVNCVIV